MTDVSNAPSVPYPTSFEDLSEGQAQTIKTVMRFSLRRIADAINNLKAAQRRLTPEVMTHFKITTLNASARADLRTVMDNYYRIVGALLGHQNLEFEGETSGPYGVIGDALGDLFADITPAAYVWSLTPPDLGDKGVVHLVKHRVFDRPLPDQGRIVIHEVGHRFAGLRDKKYYKASRVINISRKDALVNADTYAHFAIPIPPGPSLRITP